MTAMTSVRGACALAVVLAFLDVACSSRHRLGRIDTDDTGDSPATEATTDDAADGGGAAGAAGGGRHSGEAVEGQGEFVAQ